ncbi:lysine N(6)-hydroxylase/L-ornithine N(5)-oxygenase family protein [Virgibacillus flavescens]|uniref:lysine N(6)-hydroxylase/L-ornithine N(5)-oxygenase family protein n=1 Tax=Virgibacillus flavescens TaxID=1611422 RepID=UPI003D34DDBC
MKKQLYDVIGIGVGPYNLGLAALLDEVDEVESLFLERRESFDWHPGMLIEGTDLQVPFLADLVTLADPRSRFTFLQYLHEQDRLYQFFFFNRFDIPRKEYNDYIKWAANKLDNCLLSREVTNVISHDEAEPFYEIVVLNRQTEEEERYFAKHVVLGTGTIPAIPKGVEHLPKSDVLHTSKYLYHEKDFKNADSITVIGSGQSAAEVFYDLLYAQADNGYDLNWFTRTSGFFQLESAKLGQEVFSPDYVEYFHSLSFEQRMDALPALGQLRKGIDKETLKSIYDLLYHRSVANEKAAVRIQPATALKEIKSNEKSGYSLTLHQWQEEKTFTIDTNKVILATGYKPNIPDWITKFQDDIVWEDEKRFKVSANYEIEFKQKRKNRLFTLVNIEHSHGAGATNLGLAVQRNQTIINTITGKEVYPIRNNTVFQQFSSE